jgi:hypothetical protein
MASGINNTFRQVGIATGIAGLGAIFQHQITHKTTAMLAATPAGQHVLQAAHGGLSGALVSGGATRLARALPPGARGALTHAYRVGFTSALTDILVIASLVALTGAAFAFALVRGRDFVASVQPGEAAEAGEPVGAAVG